jgi:uncharacterized membrane protein YsdA (DUF1294 family)
MSVTALLQCSVILLYAKFFGTRFQYFLLINVLTFCTVALDKLKSTYNFWRIKESDMFVQFGFGGWLGGIIGMLIFRHKTRKSSFLWTVGLATLSNVLITSKVVGVW